MRIKQYDYETCSKLKNPMGDYEEVSDFVNNFFTNLDGETYLKTGYIAFFLKDTICFSHIDSLEIVYRVGKEMVGSIASKEHFPQLRNMFLAYKLKEGLQMDLPINTVITKQTKI